jgi:hypothetical protein
MTFYTAKQREGCLPFHAFAIYPMRSSYLEEQRSFLLGKTLKPYREQLTRAFELQGVKLSTCAAAGRLPVVFNAISLRAAFSTHEKGTLEWGDVYRSAFRRETRIQDTSEFPEKQKEAPSLILLLFCVRLFLFAAQCMIE